MTLEVHVVNRKTYTGKDAIYVGRPSVLGNPFTVRQHGEGVCIEKYKDWLNIQWMTGNQVVKAEINRLTDMLIEQGSLTLMCWCHPKPCHADVLAKALLNRATKRIES